jgi:hypothetical protein
MQAVAPPKLRRIQLLQQQIASAAVSDLAAGHLLAGTFEVAQNAIEPLLYAS